MWAEACVCNTRHVQYAGPLPLYLAVQPQPPRSSTQLTRHSWACSQRAKRASSAGSSKRSRRSRELPASLASMALAADSRLASDAVRDTLSSRGAEKPGSAPPPVSGAALVLGPAAAAASAAAAAAAALALALTTEGLSGSWGGCGSAGLGPSIDSRLLPTGTARGLAGGWAGGTADRCGAGDIGCTGCRASCRGTGLRGISKLPLVSKLAMRLATAVGDGGTGRAATNATVAAAAGAAMPLLPLPLRRAIRSPAAAATSDFDSACSPGWGCTARAAEAEPGSSGGPGGCSRQLPAAHCGCCCRCACCCRSASSSSARAAASASSSSHTAGSSPSSSSSLSVR